MHGVLKDIIEHKRREVAQAKARTPFAELEALVAQAEAPRNFFAAVTHHPDAFHISVIAEIKRRSPSAGLIRPEYAELVSPSPQPAAPTPPIPPAPPTPPESAPRAAPSKGNGHKSSPPNSRPTLPSASGRPPGFDPVHTARRYHANGAAAISCLTDEHFFGGQLSFIDRIKEAVPLPVLRKDFIIDPWQLWESRAAGADAILLIAECLTISEMLDLLILAQQLRLTVLLETHSVDSLLRVRPHVGFPHPSYCLLGINNRDLVTQKVDINHTLRLLDLVEEPSVLVSESGISTSKDVRWLRHNGVRIVLVGEHLMRAEDPGAALASLLGQPVR